MKRERSEEDKGRGGRRKEEERRCNRRRVSDGEDGKILKINIFQING